MSEELSSKLSQRTSLMGIKIWSLIGICVGFFLVLILLLSICFWVLLKTYESKAKRKPPGGAVRRRSSTELLNHGHSHGQVGESSVIRGANGNSSGNIRVEKVTPSSDGVLLTITDSSNADGPPEQVLVHVGISRKTSSGGGGAGGGSSRGGSGRDFHVDSSTTLFSQHRPKSSGEASMGEIMEEQYSDPHLAGWGHWFTFKELQDATDEFSPTNLIGEGGYGLVFKGQLPNNITIAVKNLLNNVGQAEKDFKVEVETIGRVRHKNLVRLLGYCLEGRHRMLVYEYVNNGNLEQWLHGALGKDSPLTWEARIKIAMGTAKALQYLHEALEPKVVHRDVKSSNILVDKHWNPKVSDFGLAKLLESEKSHVTTRVMGTFGYVAPEYASTGLLNEQNDVYSFGVLLVEIITGRYPVDYSRPAAEANLVEWLKEMVRSRRSAEVLDPRIEVKPTARLLKRLLLVALRCLDPASEKRPKMGHVVHMLEAEEFPREERQKSREQGQWSRASENSDGSSQNISKEDSALESVLEGCGENEVR